MKKIIIISLFFLLLVIANKKEEYNLTKDTIRFRVIANSNTQKDLKIKELVVENLSNLLFYGDRGNIDNERDYIIKNLGNVEKKIDDLFKSNNYEKTYNISYGLNYFPEKEYNGKTFKEGEYESLVIEIGEAKGNNYWCILYPPLCMIDEDKEVKYKSKLFEIIKGIF